MALAFLHQRLKVSVLHADAILVECLQCGLFTLYLGAVLKLLQRRRLHALAERVSLLEVAHLLHILAISGRSVHLENRHDCLHGYVGVDVRGCRFIVPHLL